MPPSSRLLFVKIPYGKGLWKGSLAHYNKKTNKVILLHPSLEERINKHWKLSNVSMFDYLDDFSVYPEMPGLFVEPRKKNSDLFTILEKCIQYIVPKADELSEKELHVARKRFFEEFKYPKQDCKYDEMHRYFALWRVKNKCSLQQLRKAYSTLHSNLLKRLLKMMGEEITAEQLYYFAEYMILRLPFSQVLELYNAPTSKFSQMISAKKFASLPQSDIASILYLC